MTGPELDLLEGGGGFNYLREHRPGPAVLGGRIALAAECENGDPHGRFRQVLTSSADYVSLLAVRAHAKARGHRYVAGAAYQRRYDLGMRQRRLHP